MQKFCEDNNVPMCKCGGEPRLHLEGPFIWIACHKHPHKHKTSEYKARENRPAVQAAWDVQLAIADWKDKHGEATQPRTGARAR